MYLADSLLPRTVPSNAFQPSPTPISSPDTSSSTPTPTATQTSSPTSMPTIISSSGTTNTDPSPFNQSNPTQKVSPAMIAVPVVIGILIILGLGWCIFRTSRNPGSWRRSDEEIATLAREREEKRMREQGLRSVSVGSFDEVEEAKEEIRRNEFLRGAKDGSEQEAKVAKKVQFPPVVAGPFSGRGMPAGGRL